MAFSETVYNTAEKEPYCQTADKFYLHLLTLNLQLDGKTKKLLFTTTFIKKINRQIFPNMSVPDCTSKSS
jgi:hypothetical protein